MTSEYGFIKVAAAVPLVSVADAAQNGREIVRLIREADQAGARVIVFPELSITGYSCGDLFFTHTLQEAAEQALERIISETGDLDIVSIAGLPYFDGAHLFNCAAVVHRGVLLGVVPKTYIPNYGEFYEGRWFSSGERARLGDITLAGQSAPFRSNLIFDFGKLRFGVEICEDMWVGAPPSVTHATAGANVIFNLSATNAVIGKGGYRRMLVKQRSFTSHCGYVFVSAGVGESTTDTLYAAHALVGENGSLLLDETQFAFESKVFYTELDLDRLDADRKKRTTFACVLKPSHEYQTVHRSFVKEKTFTLTRRISKMPFVPSSPAGRDERMQEIYDILAMSLAKRLRHVKTASPVIGISGGLDSTLALLITVRAMDLLGKDRKGVLAITMPGFGTSGRTKGNALRLMELLGVTSREISIHDACLQHFKDIGHDPAVHDVTYENAQARERTQILMDLANKTGGIVIGTGDLSELALGWATYGGDHLSMYGVNSGVPKTLIRHLVAWIGGHVLTGELAAVVGDILDTPVSPELLPPDGEGALSQKTEEILGDYILHDFFLYYFVRFGFPPKKILFLANHAFAGDYGPEVIRACLKTFFRRFFQNQFKRSCMPDGPKIGSITLSPRTDWRMPSDAEARLWLEEI